MQTPDRHLGNAKVIATVAYVFDEAESSQSERLNGSVLPNMTTPKARSLEWIFSGFDVVSERLREPSLESRHFAGTQQ